ncbi:putative polyketide synthase protein [Hypoxylon sp. FL1284]|nr:putative polyketide synthase protein [Hypoxylon sp. FL1284]
MGPLIARARDAQKPDPVLNDIYAVQALSRMDYDIQKFEIDDSQATMNTLRAMCLDRWTTEFLASNPCSTVVHLGCGLDSRCLRLQPDLTSVRWIDVDLPDAIELRSKVMPNPGGDYSLLAADITKEEWLKQIPTDRPTVIIGQALLVYLKEDVGKLMIQRLVDHFNSGQLIIDCVNTVVLSLQQGIQATKANGTRFEWGIDDPKTLESLHPKLKLLDCLGPTDLAGFSRMPLGTRLMLSTYSYLPWYRYVSAYVRYSF